MCSAQRVRQIITSSLWKSPLALWEVTTHHTKTKRYNRLPNFIPWWRVTFKTEISVKTEMLNMLMFHGTWLMNDHRGLLHFLFPGLILIVLERSHLCNHCVCTAVLRWQKVQINKDLEEILWGCQVLWVWAWWWNDPLQKFPPGTWGSLRNAVGSLCNIRRDLRTAQCSTSAVQAMSQTLTLKSPPFLWASLYSSPK